MKIEDKFVVLENGQKFPRIGFGSYGIDEEQVEELFYKALTELKINHIDTAWAYHNEEAVGKALQRAFKDGVKREDVWITSKLFMHQKNNVEGAL